MSALSLRPLHMPEDLATVHAWVTQEYARYWGLTGKSVHEVTESYREILLNSDVYLGLHNAVPAFLVEIYEPSAHSVGAHYPVEVGDRGMHILVAPASAPIAGFTWSVFKFTLDFMFDELRCARVVVEPDIRNAKIHALNRRAGFRYQRVIELREKRAHLAFCTRDDYRAALERQNRQVSVSESLIDHVQPEVWSAVSRALIAKSISELSHERVLQPEPVGAAYELSTDDPSIRYRFRARVLQLNHWDVDASSIEKLRAGAAAPLDALAFVLELKQQLGLSSASLPVYLAEITSTLYAAAYKHVSQQHSAADLVHADFQELEAAMTAGHPCFIANSGRVGFDARDYLAYAPETGADIHLIWLAASRQHTELSAAADLTYERLIEEELDAETRAAFQGELERQGLNPGDYWLLPVHPWQWFNKLFSVFAPDIAARDLVCLGYGPDAYRAQQSIRTFFNRSQPHKRYVKTALSVLNMGFMRGLSTEYMRTTPAINDYIAELIAGDASFVRYGFEILREVAGVGYHNTRFEAAVPKGSPYRKMLAALWRESPVPRLAPGQRVMTMAALLHRDRDGSALLPQLIHASGIGVDAWLDAYFGCYLRPLLHCFFAYDLAFMPHGENVILVLEHHVPRRVFMKDIAEEVAIMDSSRELPELVQRIRVSVPEALKLLSIFTDVFDDVLRFVAQILLEQADYSEQQFWNRVAACARLYQNEHPELRSNFAKHDLFCPEFQHSCLNRLQLRNNRQMVDLTDPAANLQFAGYLDNPISQARRSQRQPAELAQGDQAVFVEGDLLGAE